MNVNIDREKIAPENENPSLEEIFTEEEINKALEEKYDINDKETFGALLDLLGVIGGKGSEEEFENDKQAILESGLSLKDFGQILGEEFSNKFGDREKQSVKIQRLTETAILPKYAHDTDACADIYASEDITIEPGKTELVPTGIAMAIPVGYVVHLYPRSSTGLKTPLRLSNSVGVIDSGYRGEIKGIFTNYGTEAYTIKKGDRIMQMSLDAAPMALFEEVDDVSSIGKDRKGGFGSTGA